MSQTADPALNSDTVQTLEAFADTIVPGNKRFPDDRAIAGVCADAGAVQAGALTLLQEPAGGLAPWLTGLAQMLNGQVQAFLAERGNEPEAGVPPFVGLSYDDRVAVVLRLVALDNPERQPWVNLVMFSNMAYDSAPHLHTVDALAAGHPGLLGLGYQPPGADGRWRFPRYSYQRELADIHPRTGANGSLS
jgi:enediyne biosynthesis protein E8